MPKIKALRNFAIAGRHVEAGTVLDLPEDEARHVIRLRCAAPAAPETEDKPKARKGAA